MSSFSTIACYSALTSCSQYDILQAYARMVASLIQIKRYKVCNAESLSTDFKGYFGFPIPYHPMQTVLNECIKMGFVTYNSSVHQAIPNYDRIDHEDFMEIVQQKDNEYHKILSEFSEYLIKTYNFHSSEEDLNDRIIAFIERYGIKTAADKTILRRIKNDYWFADFLIYCEENGRSDVLDYLNEYIVGLALSEVFTYCEAPETYTAKDARIYLDTGILFSLFGIDSSNRENSYKDFIDNIRHLGMHIMVYEHTINEMIGIVENSKPWIGNPDFDASRASEATYYFVSHNWSIGDIDEFSCNLRIRLNDAFNICIDKMAYPKIEDIRTPFEATIKDMIIAEYKGSNPHTSIEENEYSIDQDAKSIFFTQHKNGTVVPYHLNDVRNIFITKNRSLAKVGYDVSYSLAGAKENFIPTVMTDIKWGTLLWFNSPSVISLINRPRLVSAAYMAFRPSEEVIRKLNFTLKKLEEQGDITPEQCYLLKVSPVAQRLLCKKTANNPDRIIDLTPLEILKELQQQAFDNGSLSRQKEIDDLTNEKKNVQHELAKERQKKAVDKCLQENQSLTLRIKSIQNELEELEAYLNEQEGIKNEIRKTADAQIKKCKLVVTGVALLLAFGVIYVGINWSWILAVVSSVIPIAMGVIAMWNNDKVKWLSLFHRLKIKIETKQEAIRRYSTEKVNAKKQKCADLLSILETAKDEKKQSDILLDKEEEKLKELTSALECVSP